MMNFTARNTFNTLAILLIMSATAFGQNYVKTETCLDNNAYNVISDYQYYDGLGAPSLYASNGVNTSGKYVYTLQTYDLLGREKRKWLPVLGNSTVNALSEDEVQTNASITYGDEIAYREQHYNAIGQLVSTDVEGSDWQGVDMKIHYGTNEANSVRHYTAPLGESYSLQLSGFYPAGSLVMEEIVDEDGNVIKTFKDHQGHVVLERRANGNDTYYVYNELSQLRFVLSPEYQNSGYKAIYGYEYRYDSHGNCVKKILPQRDYIQYWYDADNRQIFMQDAILRSKGLYRFTFYDQYGRLAVQGVCTSCNRKRYRVTATYASNAEGLCGSGYMISVSGAVSQAILERAFYYDNYSFLNTNALFNGKSGLVLSTAPINATGRQTGSIETTSDGKKIYTAVYYDSKGNIIAHYENYNGEEQLKKDNQFTFTNNAYYELSSLIIGGNTYNFTINTTYSNKNDKPVTRVCQVGTRSNLTLYSYEYNGLGRVSIINRFGGAAGSVTYKYNLRGWLDTLDGKGFKEYLYYADTKGKGTPRFNGNISVQQWQTDNENFMRGYKFEYDNMNRLRNAIYGEKPNLSDHQNRYNETVLNYSSNGSILRYQRRGKKQDGEYGKIDNLNIRLDGNQLKNVEEDAQPVLRNGAFDFIDTPSANHDVQEYWYDDNGSLVSDKNKGIALIEYDNYNYPRRLQFTNGNVIEYVYTSDGRKLRTIYTTAVSGISVPIGGKQNLTPSTYVFSDTIEYIGNYVLENGVIKKYLFEGGYCSYANSQTSPTLYYFTTDHLGNVRAVADETGVIRQINHYYPFGGIYADASYNDDIQKQKYNSKELDRMHGLNLYDYGARHYDPILSQFTQQDLMAEKYYHLSPYAYCGNNPVNAIDPNGMDIWDIDTKGNITNIVKTEYYDMIRIINENGEYSASVKFNYGTVYHQFLEDSNGKGYELFKINSDDNGKNAFEMLAQNTDVEWTKGVIGESEIANIITTSHKTSEESGFVSYISNNFKEGTIIKDITHNHPSGSAFPSFGKTHGDVAFARYIEKLTGQKPTFHIYSLNDGKYQYVKYGPNSTINDFILNGASTNEIIVYGRKNKR